MEKLSGEKLFSMLRTLHLLQIATPILYWLSTLFPENPMQEYTFWSYIILLYLFYISFYVTFGAILKLPQEIITTEEDQTEPTSLNYLKKVFRYLSKILLLILVTWVTFMSPTFLAKGFYFHWMIIAFIPLSSAITAIGYIGMGSYLQKQSEATP
ncbi:MAG: hypothetical protein ACI83D_000477 [Planctomycetota bacterium]|jgi:hypothetical protein